MPLRRLGLIALLALGLAWIWANRVTAPPASSTLPPAPIIGYPAPDFELITLDGSVFRLSEQLGRPVVLNFWATWCPPCRAEIPALQAASDHYGDQLLIVGVDQVEPAAIVLAYANQIGMRYTAPLDSRGAASTLYRVRSLPTTFFIDREGIIREMQIGGLNDATLAQMLRSVFP